LTKKSQFILEQR